MISARAGRWWSSALTLAERVALFSDAQQEISRHSPDAFDDARATTKPIDRWRAQRPFDRSDVLARRLRLDQLTVEHFETLLATPAGSLAGTGDPPRWVDAVERVDAVARQIAETARRASDGDSGGMAPVRAFVEPFVTAVEWTP